MAGYILGLGDRHLSNILIDQITAEVIHIDFGKYDYVIFETSNISNIVLSVLLLTVCTRELFQPSVAATPDGLAYT